MRLPKFSGVQHIEDTTFCELSVLQTTMANNDMIPNTVKSFNVPYSIRSFAKLPKECEDVLSKIVQYLQQWTMNLLH